VCYQSFETSFVMSCEPEYRVTAEACANSTESVFINEWFFCDGVDG
jgi:hypothetical protein